MTENSALPLQGIQYVFLDRDGVINRKAPEGHWISKWKDFEILPGVEEAIAQLNAAGLKVIVVTNQRGIALGRFTDDDFHSLHASLCEHLAAHRAHVDAIYYCPHDRGKCDCRKPGTGLFMQAFRDFPNASPVNSLMIGDSVSDIEAGTKVGMKTVFIQGDAALQAPGSERAASLATRVGSSLRDVVLQEIKLG